MNESSTEDINSSVDVDDVISPSPGTSWTLTNGVSKELRVVVNKCNGVETKSPEPVPAPHSSRSPTQVQQGVTARSTQFKILKAALGGKKLPGSVFLWGGSAAGKVYTLGKVLEETDIHVIKIHSTEIFCGRRAFYETFVKQLVSRTKFCPSDFKCDSLRSLYSNVYDYFCEVNEISPIIRVVAIIQSVELLKGEYDDILTFLTTLQDTSQSPICVVLTSTLPPAHFMPTIMDHSIIPVHFPQYTMEELTSIIIEHKIGVSSGVTGSFRNFYVKMIVNMFFIVCRDVRKLLRLARTHWDAFEKLVQTSETLDVTRLWKKLEPLIKEQFYEMNAASHAMRPDQGAQSQSSQQNLGKSLDLPLNAKYLLIAAYLATHNPPSSDKRFFVKVGTGKVKKRGKPASKTETLSKTFVRSFELNRLTAIFASIQVYCDDKTVNKNRNISFMTLLTTLCQNKLIQHIGEDSSGNQKYKSLVDYDTVLEISRSVKFELNKYLFRLI